MSASALPLPTTLGNVRVTINGQYAPIFFVSPGQISVLVPQAVTPDNGIENATIQVIDNNVASNAVTVFTNRTAPGIFSLGGNGIGPAAAEHLNGSVVGTSDPATAGSKVVLYATGLGEVDPAVPDGAASPSSPLSVAADSGLDTVTIGAQQETVTFNGLTPGLAGLFQINTSIVASTPVGTDFADIATPDAITQETTLAVGTVGNSVTGMAQLQPLTLEAGPRKHVGGGQGEQIHYLSGSNRL